MPKKLIADIYGGMKAMQDYEVDAGSEPTVPAETETADVGAEATANVAGGEELATV